MLKNMRMSIAERFKPFMHLPGSSAVLPFTTFCFKIYPAMICVYNLEGPEKVLIEEIPINVSGIVEGFTIQLDLEKGCLKVWGSADQGYFRYRIQATKSGKSYAIIPEKEPIDATFFANLPSSSVELESLSDSCENLSFGISKSQDWTMVHRRKKMMEILPFWFRLGQLIPSQPLSKTPKSGTPHLLHKANEALEADAPESFIKILETLYLGGFGEMLVPRLVDELKQGFDLPPLHIKKSDSPLCLLSEGKKLIKRMLIDAKAETVKILPCLPTEFHCGKMLNVTLPEIGHFDLEWSKKTIRRISFQPIASAKLLFQFPSNVKTFRLRRQSDGSTQFKTCGEPIEFSSTNRYFFDNFKR
jgi:hypothetical protein